MKFSDVTIVLDRRLPADVIEFRNPDGRRYRFNLERKSMATPLRIAASQQRHKPILTAQPGEREDQLWARAATFTSRVCRDNRESYALIKKAGGRRCNPDGITVSVDCDKIIDRVTLKMYDLVGSGGAPNATPVFNDTGAVGTTEDFIEPMSYPGDENPIPAPTPPWSLPGRQEMMLIGERLHAYYKAPEGLQRPDGLWKVSPVSNESGPDFEGIGAWLFDVYLTNRVAGKTVDQSWDLVVKAIEGTDEWKAKHPG